MITMLGWTSRGTMTQIMCEIVKVADICTSWSRSPRTSHTRRTGATRWMHRACACSTMRFSSTGLHATPDPVVGFDRARKVGLRSLPNASQEHLSSSVQKFAIVMPGNAWTLIDNTRHAEAKASGETLLGPSKIVHAVTWRCKPRAHARFMDETPDAPVVENIQLVFAVSFIAHAPCGFHLASASLVARTGRCAAQFLKHL